MYRALRAWLLIALLGPTPNGVIRSQNSTRLHCRITYSNLIGPFWLVHCWSLVCSISKFYRVVAGFRLNRNNSTTSWLISISPGWYNITLVCTVFTWYRVGQSFHVWPQRAIMDFTLVQLNVFPRGIHRTTNSKYNYYIETNAAKLARGSTKAWNQESGRESRTSICHNVMNMHTAQFNNEIHWTINN